MSEREEHTYRNTILIPTLYMTLENTWFSISYVFVLLYLLLDLEKTCIPPAFPPFSIHTQTSVGVGCKTFCCVNFLLAWLASTDRIVTLILKIFSISRLAPLLWLACAGHKVFDDMRERRRCSYSKQTIIRKLFCQEHQIPSVSLPYNFPTFKSQNITFCHWRKPSLLHLWCNKAT